MMLMGAGKEPNGDGWQFMNTFSTGNYPGISQWRRFSSCFPESRSSSRSGFVVPHSAFFCMGDLTGMIIEEGQQVALYRTKH